MEEGNYDDINIEELIASMELEFVLSAIKVAEKIAYEQNENEIENLDEEELTKRNYENKFYTNLLKSVKNNTECQELIANKISEEFESNEIQKDYAEDSNDSEGILQARMSTINTLILVLNIFSYDSRRENYGVIFNEINKKIEKLNFIDFAILYASVDTTNFFNNPYFEKTIKDKIAKMSNDEFIHFLLSTKEGRHNGEFSSYFEEAKINRAEDEKSNILVREIATAADIPIDSNKKAIIDNTALLAKSNIKDKTGIYNNLTETEFVRLVLMGFDFYKHIDEEIFDPDVTREKVSNLTTENLITLIEEYLSTYKTYNRIKNNHNISYRNNYIDDYLKFLKRYESIIEVGKEKGLLGDKLEKKYGIEEIRKASERNAFYRIIRTSDFVLPKAYTYFDNTTVKQYEDTDDLDEVKDRNNHELLERFEQQEAQLIDVLMDYKEIGNLIETIENVPDIRMNTVIDLINSKYSSEKTEKTKIKKPQLSLEEKASRLYTNGIKNPVVEEERRKAIESQGRGRLNLVPIKRRRYSEKELYILNYMNKRILRMKPVIFSIIDFKADKDSEFYDVINIKKEESNNMMEKYQNNIMQQPGENNIR